MLKQFLKSSIPSTPTLCTIEIAVVVLHAAPVVKRAQAYDGQVRILASALPRHITLPAKRKAAKAIQHPKPQRKPDPIGELIARAGR